MDAFGEDIQRIKDYLLKVEEIEDNDEGERLSTANKERDYEKKNTATLPLVTVVEETPMKPLSDGEVAEDVLEFEV
ncbi:toxin-antitoxin system, toxin component, RelE domain protein [Cooperia oncophora]